MRLLLCLAAAFISPACSSTVRAYPHAKDIAWVQPTHQPEAQSLKLRDGARLEYWRADDRHARLTVSGGGFIRCSEPSGDIRWMLRDASELPPPTEQAPSADGSNPLANAFYFDPDEPRGPVELTYGDAALAADDAHLYVVQFCHLANGASVVALDLRNGTVAWSSHVQGIGRVPHSRYSNVVDARIIDGALVIFGDEAAGDYIEVFSPQGERWSTKLVSDR